MEGLSNRQLSLQLLLDLNETNAESTEYERDPKFELQGPSQINKYNLIMTVIITIYHNYCNSSCLNHLLMIYSDGFLNYTIASLLEKNKKTFATHPAVKN